MMKLKAAQKKHLKGLAHKLKPVVFVGQKGITDSVTEAIDEALDKHELIKIRFIDFKEKAQKQKLTRLIEKAVDAEAAGTIGHILILYRKHPDPEKRKIQI